MYAKRAARDSARARTGPGSKRSGSGHSVGLRCTTKGSRTPATLAGADIRRSRRRSGRGAKSPTPADRAAAIPRSTRRVKPSRSMCANDGRASPITRSTSSAMPRLDVGMLRQQVVRPRQRQRGRLVSGQQHRHDLVAELTVGHAGAGLLVARRQQHGQQVRFVAAGPSPVGDDPVDDLVQLAQARARSGDSPAAAASSPASSTRRSRRCAG